MESVFAAYEARRGEHGNIDSSKVKLFTNPLKAETPEGAEAQAEAEKAI